jgi:hypothetical protein
VNHYSIYGSCLGTPVTFPELRPIEGLAPKWTFDTTPQLEPMRDTFEFGAERIYDEVHARMYRHASGHRISVDDTGDFDLSADGRHVRWQERADAWPDFVRAHLMGRVLATSLFLDGWLPLHGSAVQFGSGVVAFLAPKGFGKSSLALALTRAGARLVTDDTLPIEMAELPLAWPGVHSMRLRSDAMDAIGLARHDGEQTRDGKNLVDDLPLSRLMHAPAPLKALYILNPLVGDDIQPAAARLEVPQRIAALAVVSHVKIARMLGPSAGSVLLERAVHVVRTTPVYRLDSARDLSRLGEVAETVASWHH